MSELPSSSKDEESNLASDVKFYPPVYIQRYNAVAQILKDSHFQLQKVVDFGCAELTFLKHLKSIPNVQEISAVDVDAGVLEENKYRAAPLTADYLVRRATPLVICLYQGSIADKDTRLRHYDAATCIEIIEHLHDDVLSKLEETLFSFIRPKVVVVTTPNAEFNVLFPALQGFRHWDHKFEWTRQEFSAWCDNVVEKYPFYAVTITGIGSAPLQHQHLGCCSQAATFALLSDSYRESAQGVIATNMPYQLLARFEHPYRTVIPLTPEDIQDEVKYYLRMLAKEADWSDEPLQLNLHHLFSFPKVNQICGTKEELSKVLRSAGYSVITGEEEEESYVLYLLEDSDDDQDSACECDNDLDD